MYTFTYYILYTAGPEGKELGESPSLPLEYSAIILNHPLHLLHSHKTDPVTPSDLRVSFSSSPPFAPRDFGIEMGEPFTDCLSDPSPPHFQSPVCLHFCPGP